MFDDSEHLQLTVYFLRLQLVSVSHAFISAARVCSAASKTRLHVIAPTVKVRFPSTLLIVATILRS
jgi:hypothetical protein